MVCIENLIYGAKNDLFLYKNNCEFFFVGAITQNEKRDCALKKNRYKVLCGACGFRLCDKNLHKKNYLYFNML